MPAARAHAVGARAVHLRAGRVVHLCSVGPDRATSARQRRRHRGGAPARALCWRCACLRCRACVPHARVACTCCACACCACLRYARLRFPCSRCVHLLCLPLLCVPALCAFVRCVVCLCSAHLHRVELAEPASPSTLATCHDLYPFPILSHICLLLSCIVPPSLPHFLLVLFLLFRTGKSRLQSGHGKPYLPRVNLEDIADFTTRFLREKEMETPSGQKRRGIT